jgi:hypothetical protein
MLRTTVAFRRRSGQAMVESILAMVVILLVFLALFNLSDQIRVKLLVENAAAKCARARAVGYNDFMLRKIARLSTMPAAGKCLTAADSVIIPVQPEFFALEGLGKLLQTIRLVQERPNPDLTIEGFLVTMFDGRTKVHNQVLNELREHFKEMVFETIIQRNIRLSEAPSHGKPIILYDVICNGTTNYLNLAKEILEKN